MIRSLLHGIAILALFAPCVAQAADPQTLEQFLQHKYSGFLTTLPEGRRSDGSYAWSATFNWGNVVVFSWPYKSLANFCAKQDGTFIPSILYRVGDGRVTTRAFSGLDAFLGKIDNAMLEIGLRSTVRDCLVRRRAPAGLIRSRHFRR